MEINFKPSIKQFQAWKYLTDKETNFIGYGGGANSGKSYLMCYWLTINALAYPETAWGLCRRELTTLKKTTLVTLFKVFKECNITENDYVYNQQLNIITFNHNQSKIYLIDTAYKPSDPLYETLGGYELTGVAIDESSETDIQAIQILFTRIRHKLTEYNLTAKVLETFNPAKTHIYSRYYKPWKEGRLKQSYKFVRALPSDNPGPGVQEYINNILLNSDERTKQRLIYGNFEYDDDPNCLIDYDKILSIWNNEHINVLDKGSKLIGTILSENDKQEEIKDKYITCDPARLGEDTTRIFVWIGLTIVKAITQSKSRTNEIADIIKQLQKEYQIPNKNVIIDSDGVGGGVSDLIPQCTEFNNNAKPLNNENFNHIKSQCYFKLADIINKNCIYIQPNVLTPEDKTKLIDELGQVKAIDITSEGKKQIVSKDQVKKHLGRSPDLSDCLMLRMHPIINKSKFVYSMVKIK